MGKLGRIACIATPMALTIASLICLLLVFLGGTNKNDSTLRDLYFFKADLTSLKHNVTSTTSIFDGTGLNPSVLSALKAAVASNKLADYYEIYLWNYCSGNGNSTSNTEDFCSPRTAEFYFNPLDEWGLNSTTLEALLPSELKSGVDAYRTASKWMFIAYTVAFFTTLGSIVVGVFATCSRWGSFFTTLVSSASTLFTILSAITSTVLFATLVGTLDRTLKPYDITLSLGSSQLALDWLAVVLSIAATLFWTISICCCSGRSPHSHAYRRDRKSQQYEAGLANQRYPVQRQPTFPFLNRGYSKLGEEGQGLVGQEYGRQPYGAPPTIAVGGVPGQQSGLIHGQEGEMEMQDYAGPYKGREGAYEPYRHQRGPSAVSDIDEV